MSRIATIDGLPVTFETSPGQDPGFIELTFPAFRPLLAQGDETLVAIGARIDGIPVGLALAQQVGTMPLAGGLTAKLLSLMVAAPYRRQGLGTDLLRQVQRQLRSQGVLGFYSVYSTRLPGLEGFERTLSRAKWNPPVFKELRLAGECGKMVEQVATWRAVQDRLGQGERYEFTPWSEVGGEADQASIDRLCEQPPCRNAPLIQPKTWKDLYDPAISLAVRRDGELMGWVAAHRLERQPGTPSAEVPQVYYVSYLDLALQRSGIMVAAYFLAFQKQAAVYGAGSIAHYSAIERAMQAVTRRRFAPIAYWVDELKVATKRLAVAPAQQDGSPPRGLPLNPANRCGA